MDLYSIGIMIFSAGANRMELILLTTVGGKWEQAVALCPPPRSESPAKS